MQLTAFVLSECALPIRDHIGDGGLYTLFAGILAISSGVFILLAYKVSRHPPLGRRLAAPDLDLWPVVRHQGKEWRTNPDHRFFGKDKKTVAPIDEEKVVGASSGEAQRAVDAEEKREAQVPAPSVP